MTVEMICREASMMGALRGEVRHRLWSLYIAGSDRNVDLVMDVIRQRRTYGDQLTVNEAIGLCVRGGMLGEGEK